MNAVDLLRLCQILQRALERVSLLLLFHQEENRLNIHGAGLMPCFGDLLGLPCASAFRPVHPLRERFEMRIERAGACIQLFGVEEIQLLSGLAAFPAGGFLQLRQQFLGPQLSQHARHMQIESSGFRAVRREPCFAHRLLPELLPGRARRRNIRGILHLLQSARE